MPLFFCESKLLLIATSYKVMYSTLTSMCQFTEILDIQNFKFRIGNDLKYYTFVRDPRSKLLSFYKDKFIKQLNCNQLNFEFQHCHRVFLEFLNLVDSTSIDQLAALQTMDLNYFVEILPYVYKMDDHFRPQNCLLLDFKNKFDIGFDKIGLIDIEDERALKIFFLKYGFSVVPKINTTSNVEFFEFFNSNSLGIIEKLYFKDFLLFGTSN